MKKTLLQEAYRKLKGSVLYDKTQAILRAEISKFENDNFSEKMGKLFEAINTGKEWNDVEKDILKSIRAYTFPKKIEEVKKDSKTPIVISNISENCFAIEKYNNFIDMSIEGHIIGVLWILMVGYKFDKALYPNCLGNRLSDKLVFKTGETTKSPNLFKPYFEQYESWRNKGLSEAEKAVNDNEQSVIITMLDLTRYYYNVDFSEKLYNSLVEKCCKKNDKSIERVCGLVYKILKEYSVCLGEKNKTILPIGFLPSNILANIYLKEFDESIQKLNNTVYYGRYVDDMIIVTKISSTSDLKDRITEKGVEEVSDYMIDFLKVNNILKNAGDCLEIVGYEFLEVQKNKFRFFFVDKDGYDTIINKIQKDIYSNSSEFKFLPEEMTVEFDEDIFKMEREDSVNKLRAVNAVSIDKYALSKALGKNIMMSKFAEKEAINSFIKSMGQVLKSAELINNYTLWESILNYYVLNARWDKIEDFTILILLALNNMDESSGKNSTTYSYLLSNNIDSVGDSLVKFYWGSLVRATSIVWGNEIKNVLDSVSSKFNELTKYSKYAKIMKVSSIHKLRKNICSSRMMNNNFLPVTIEECMGAFKPNDKSDDVIRFNELDQYLCSSQKVSYQKDMRMYAPYVRTPFTILYTNLLKQIKDEKIMLMSDKDCVEFVCKEYADNFSCDVPRNFLENYIEAKSFDENGNYFISIDTKTKENDDGKLRVAVANAKMNKKDIEDILQNKKRNMSKRCSEISKIVREATVFKSDFLLFPEAYVPITYLPYLEKKARDNNMVIICGLEHIKVGKNVYNFTVTIVPLFQDKIRYSIPFFHLKKFYSPEEKNEIEKNGFNVVTGNSHTLFQCKNVKFATYCCYELTSIEERAIFKKEAEIVFGVEWNKDINYFKNIMESLSRDISCYCIQSNMAEYGDSRIIQPSSSVVMNIARVKGGVNGLAIIDDVDIALLRRHHKTGNEKPLKPLPAGWNK